MRKQHYIHQVTPLTRFFCNEKDCDYILAISHTNYQQFSLQYFDAEENLKYGSKIFHLHIRFCSGVVNILMMKKT